MDPLLAEGLTLFRSFISTLEAAPQFSRGPALLAFRPQFGRYASKVDAYLASQPAIDGRLAGQLQAAAALAKDGADQSAKHHGSYLSRVKAFVGSGGTSSSGLSPILALAAIVVAVFLLR